MDNPEIIATANQFLENTTFIASLLVSAVVILLIVITFLIIDRMRLLKRHAKLTDFYFESKEKESEALKQIINTYHEGNLKIVENLKDINSVLISIQNNRK